MTTNVYYHPACLDHDTGPTHPESADRLSALIDRLKEDEFGALNWELAPRAHIAQLLAVHDRRYLDGIKAKIPALGRADFEPSGTVISALSEEAIYRASGAVVAAIDSVIAGKADNAFCAVRPPGHHAKKGNTSGFCFVNNVAVGVRHLQNSRKMERIGVIDFDVHHGNGTQELLEKDPNVFFGSIHQGLIFPNTGKMGQSASGNVVNIPVARRYSGKDFTESLKSRILNLLREFKPEFILLSAGFDAHRADPVGDLALDNEDFAQITRDIISVAKQCCGGRIVSVLEGGYRPSAVAAAGASHVRELMNA
ncbi:MAG: histone deacetylase family protein [Rhodospirillales bacterium]|nr:histone deacetylase family protein [Rhodospirillales bacterium]